MDGTELLSRNEEEGDGDLDSDNKEDDEVERVDFLIEVILIEACLREEEVENDLLEGWYGFEWGLEVL